MLHQPESAPSHTLQLHQRFLLCRQALLYAMDHMQQLMAGAERELVGTEQDLAPAAGPG